MGVRCLLLAVLCVALEARFHDNRDRKNFVLCAFKSSELCLKREFIKDIRINIKDDILNDQYTICGISDLKPIKQNSRLYKISSLKHINGQFRIVYCKHIYSASSDSIIAHRYGDDFVRHKRQSLRGRYRGQTQSQFLSMDKKAEEGKAEAHAAPDSSRATVSGRSGIGQAQSQSIFDPLCDNCDEIEESSNTQVNNMPFKNWRNRGQNKHSTSDGPNNRQSGSRRPNNGRDPRRGPPQQGNGKKPQTGPLSDPSNRNNPSGGNGNWRVSASEPVNVQNSKFGGVPQQGNDENYDSSKPSDTDDTGNLDQSGAPQKPSDETFSGQNLGDRQQPLPKMQPSKSGRTDGYNGILPYDSANQFKPSLDRSRPTYDGDLKDPSNLNGRPQQGGPGRGLLPLGSRPIAVQRKIGSGNPVLIPGVLHTDPNGNTFLCCSLTNVLGSNLPGSASTASSLEQLVPQHQRPVSTEGQNSPGYHQQLGSRDQLTPDQQSLYSLNPSIIPIAEQESQGPTGPDGVVHYKPTYANIPGILNQYYPGYISGGLPSQDARFTPIYAPGNLNYLPAGPGSYFTGNTPILSAPGLLPQLPTPTQLPSPTFPWIHQASYPGITTHPGYGINNWKPGNTLLGPGGVTVPSTGLGLPSIYGQGQQPQGAHEIHQHPHDQYGNGQHYLDQYGSQQANNQIAHPQGQYRPGQYPPGLFGQGQQPQSQYRPGQQSQETYGGPLYSQGPLGPGQGVQNVGNQYPYGQYGPVRQPHGQFEFGIQPQNQYGSGQSSLNQSTIGPGETIYNPGAGKMFEVDGSVTPGGETYDEEKYGPSPYGAIGTTPRHWINRPSGTEWSGSVEQNGPTGSDVLNPNEQNQFGLGLDGADPGYPQYGLNTPGTGVGPNSLQQYGPRGQNNTGINNVEDRPESGTPQNVLDPNSITDDDDSEAQATISQASNGTLASASSKGGDKKGKAQTQVQGSYTGGGSFSAQAQISDESKGAESQVTGGKQGASSSAQGRGKNNKSQAQVELGSETGSLQTQAQSEGVMHSSNSQVQGSVKGGMADAQARGPGSTSSQAQIGFTPYKDGDKSHEQLKTPFTGSGSASAQSSGRTGQSQSQLQGVFKYGIKYNGAAQSGASLDKDAVFPNRLAFNKIDVFDENNKNIDVDHLINSASESPNNNEEIEHTESLETKNVDHPHSDHHNDESNPPVNNDNRRSFNFNHRNEYEYGTNKNEGVTDDYDVEAGYGGEVDTEYPNYDEFGQSPTHQSLETSRKKGLDLRQSSAGNTQHIVLGSLSNHDAEITQRDSEQHPDETRIYQPGERVPGTGGYTIPIGFTGSVKSVASKGKTYAIGTRDSPSQAQTVSLTPGTGKINYNHPKSIDPKNLKSLDKSNKRKIDDDSRYVSVSKSVTGALDSNNKIKQQYSHTYYTKSSSCGYFAFTCTIVSGSKGKRKICTPKIPTNPDGTPMNC